MAERVKAAVYGPTGALLHIEEDLQHISAEHGVLVISGPTESVLWAPGFWASVSSIRIND